MDISNRIKQKMAAKNLKAVDLVKATGASKGSVSQWLNSINSPGGKYIVPLCKALGCDSGWLLTGVGNSGFSNEDKNIATAPFQATVKKLPVISHVQAGGWTEALDFRSLGDDIEWEDSPATAGDNAFWLKVVGDSMTAQTGQSIPEGHLILVNPNIPAENGSLVVAKLEGSDEVTFKKLFIDAGQKYLKPLNSNYRHLEVNGNCRIVGVVTEAKVKF